MKSNQSPAVLPPLPCSHPTGACLTHAGGLALLLGWEDPSHCGPTPGPLAPFVLAPSVAVRCHRSAPRPVCDQGGTGSVLSSVPKRELQGYQYGIGQHLEKTWYVVLKSWACPVLSHRLESKELEELRSAFARALEHLKQEWRSVSRPSAPARASSSGPGVSSGQGGLPLCCSLCF